MIILIDAYNLLKTVDARNRSFEEYAWYINRLKLYAAKKGHQLILVFDGGFWHHAHQEKERWGTMVFAGKGKSADEVIKRCLQEVSPSNTLLITSDQELVKYAQRCAIESLRSHLFDKYVEEALTVDQVASTKCSITKLSSSSNDELDMLMFQDKNSNIKKDDSDHYIHTDGRTLSKKTINRQRLLKKL